MNIILVFTFGISLKSWKDSGLLNREIELYNELTSNHNIEYTFITFGNESDFDIIQNEKIKIIPIYKYIKKSKSNYINVLKSLFFPFKIKKYLKNVDIIKTNQLNGSWVALVLKSILKKPLIIRTGYNLYEFSINENKMAFKKYFYRQLTNLSLKYSNIYTVSSDSDKQFLVENFTFQKEIQVIPNWVNRINFNSFENRYPNKVLAVGRLEEQKNFSSLITDLQGTGIEINIVGEGSKKHELEFLAKKLNVDLNFLGKFKYDELENIYSNYRVLINSSNYEGNSKVILEAMANGCVVIARKNKNNSEIVQNNLNGFTYKDKNDLISKVPKVLNNKNIFDKVASNAYDVIKQNNIIDNIILKEIANYTKLIDS